MTSASFPGRSRRFHRLSGTVNVGLLAFLALTSSSSLSTSSVGHFGLGLGLVHAAAAGTPVEMTHDDTTYQDLNDLEATDLLHEATDQHPDERHLQRGGGGGNKKAPPPTPAPVSGPPPTTPAPVASPTTPAPVAAPTTPAPVEPPTAQCYACSTGTNAGQSCAAPGETSDCGTVGTTTTVTCSKAPYDICTTDADCGGKGSKCNVVTQTPTHGTCAEVVCTEAPTGTPTASPTKGPTSAPTKGPTDAPSARPSKAPTGESCFADCMPCMHTA